MKEFKEFVMRGNVMDLAVGVIIGTMIGNLALGIAVGAALGLVFWLLYDPLTNRIGG